MRSSTTKKAFSDSELAANLRRAREERGWTPSELASAAGFPVESVQAWEAGERPPRPQHLYLLCQALGVPVASLFGEDERHFVPWSPNTGRLEICLQCGARDHLLSASHCQQCGYLLESSQCPGQVEDAYLGMHRPCLNLVPPGQMHCQVCGAPSLWAELSDRMRFTPLTGTVAEATPGDLEAVLERIEKLEQDLHELKGMLKGLRGQVYRSGPA